MPKRKANWWPPSILSDPDVLSVDDEGRFVLCKICHVHYAVHGGKKPKPVIMNSNFRTRAWDVHKERTNSHRLQKQQERLQQAKAQQAPAAAATTTDQQPAGAAQGQPRLPPPLQTSQQKQQQQMQSSQALPTQPRTQPQSQAMSAIASQAQVLTQAPPRQVQGQGQAPAHLTQPVPVRSPPEAPLRSPSEVQALQQRRQQQQHELEETKDAGATERLQVPPRNSVMERSTSAVNAETIATAMTGPNSMHADEMMNGAGKRPASAMAGSAPMPARRRVFRAGSPGSSMQLLAESEAARRQNAHDRHVFIAAAAAKKTRPAEHAVAVEQADSSARWRHMHDDVSRALNAVPRRRQQCPSSYTSGELRAAKTLAQTETGDLGGNNSERVAKKLQSLNAEYHASNMRHADAYNMRHSDVFDRRSAGYKEYWGTLRYVYTSSGATSGGSGSAGNAMSYRKQHHRNSALAKPGQEESKETEADSTTPDDSGSSEDAFKPAVVVHDASLISAIERLTDATTKQLANLSQKQASDTKDALEGLTSVMTDLRVQHGNAFGRIIELQEKHLKVMEGILEIKLRKEAARNAKKIACSSNGSTTGSSSSSPGSSSNGGSGLSSQGAETAQRART
ncbi:unnamed protein product [Phytophthora lilii]|uniref:Unnamed protein product n=1 Tax=Phytophthora lilii TaxID=2077276 RepID=A0A9W6U2P4_9STRA|nr:unnamed protein product [Phytophthora lilii]